MIRFFVATILSGIWTMICATGAALSALMNKPHWVTVVTRAWGRGIIAVCGIKVEVEGLENLAGIKSYVLVSNHQSFFDTFAIAGFMPGNPRFVAKKELLKIPIVGFAMQPTLGSVISGMALNVDRTMLAAARIRA